MIKGAGYGYISEKETSTVRKRPLLRLQNRRGVHDGVQKQQNSYIHPAYCFGVKLYGDSKGKQVSVPTRINAFGYDGEKQISVPTRINTFGYDGEKQISVPIKMKTCGYGRGKQVPVPIKIKLCGYSREKQVPIPTKLNTCGYGKEKQVSVPIIESILLLRLEEVDKYQFYVILLVKKSKKL